MTRHRDFLVMTVCASLLALGYACGDDDDKNKNDDQDDDEAALKGDCATISEACHHADEGDGEAHDCHELAHENDTAACTDQKDSCITACELLHEE